MKKRLKYEVGTLVWAKMATYPWWPAVIHPFSENMNEEVIQSKKKGCALVKFFGEEENPL